MRIIILKHVDSGEHCKLSVKNVTKSAYFLFKIAIENLRLSNDRYILLTSLSDYFNEMNFMYNGNSGNVASIDAYLTYCISGQRFGAGKKYSNNMWSHIRSLTMREVKE